jgi:hypothetical protein
VIVDQGAVKETWCVASNGVVALWDTKAFHYELTALAFDADPAAFVRPDQG